MVCGSSQSREEPHACFTAGTRFPVADRSPGAPQRRTVIEVAVGCRWCGSAGVRTLFLPRCCLATTLLTLLTLTTLAAAPDAARPDVKVRPLDGEAVSGKLTELSAVQVTVQTKAGPQTLPAGGILWVELPDSPPLDKPAAWIELQDGSQAVAVNYTAAGGKARIDLTSGQTVEVATRAVRTVRFRPLSPELAGQWREITAQAGSSDLVVIHKTSQRTVDRGENEPTTITEQALDQLEGTVLEVTPTSVRFELDGEKIDIRREKLAGLMYYPAARREFPPPLARLIDGSGSNWVVRDLKLDAGQLLATTVGNLPLQLPLAAISKIDFSVGNVAFLADLEADAGAGETGVSLQPANMAHPFSRLFQVRSRPPFGAESFRMGGQRFDSGLSLHSPARLVYRVPAGFRRFRAVAGVDDSVMAPGAFDLVVLGDGQELARHSFATDRPRGPLPLDLAIDGVRRVTIVIDPADGQDIGDQLNLCDARFTK
jgi:NPCBM/NEW2 domain